MRRLVVALVFISLVLLRLVTGQTPVLPEGTRVRLTIPTIDYPEYRDSETVVRRGEWEVRIRGYTPFIPGEVIEVEGVIDEYGRVKSEGMSVATDTGTKTLLDRALIGISGVRQWAVGRLQRVLPEPHSSLASGILLGVKREMPREFYDQLVATGTLHIIAASGYNVSVVASTVMAGLTLFLPHAWALGGAVVAIIVYVILAGGSASIVRAGIMGGLSLIGVGFGRVREARHLLFVSVLIMLVVKPSLVTDVGFQLSVAATLGLLYLCPILERLNGNRYLREYFYPSLAATLATAPVIYYHFERLSGLGVVVNMLILPVVPLIMFLATLTLIVPQGAYLLYVPLWWVVSVIGRF